MSSDAIRYIRYKIQESPICRLDGWVGTETDFLSSCSRRNLEESDDGRVGTLAVLDADWSVTTKYGGFFDIININELSQSIPATFGRPISCRVGTDQLLTSDINPSIYLSIYRCIYTDIYISREMGNRHGYICINS